MAICVYNQAQIGGRPEKACFAEQLCGERIDIMRTYVLALSLPFFLAAAPAALADCQSVAQKTAAKQNGKLVQVSPGKDKDGKDICVVVVSVPSTEGEKPRRVELAVPLNK